MSVISHPYRSRSASCAVPCVRQTHRMECKRKRKRERIASDIGYEEGEKATIRLLLFAGTSEGHQLCQFLSGQGAQAEVYVATAYGKSAMEPMPGIHIHAGRLSVDDIAACILASDDTITPSVTGSITGSISDTADTLVVDATHPYAVEATANIRAACDRTGATYLRLTRPALPVDEGEFITTVPDTAAAVAWLNAQPMDTVILLTTGSKELDAYTNVREYQRRVFPRVLPTAAVLRRCEQCDFPNAHIIAMQGPFSQGLNVALLRQTGATILVTKDTGSAGGFTEKLAAAREVGAQVLVIARPTDEAGQTLEQIKAELSARLGLVPPHRFPLFVSLQGRLCLVFGAGTIAARRVSILRQFGAQVRVIAPEARAFLIPEVPSSLLIPDERRGYRESDITDNAAVFLVVAATDQRQVNQQIGEACRKRNIPCSVADSAAESTFFFPAICQDGDMIAGVVSRGKNHRKTAQVAQRIRTALQEFNREGNQSHELHESGKSNPSD